VVFGAGQVVLPLLYAEGGASSRRRLEKSSAKGVFDQRGWTVITKVVCGVILVCA
jgi:hypothetical protein